MSENEGHGWAFVEEDRLVNAGPTRFIRMIIHFNNTGDNVKAYDGLSAEGRQAMVCFGKNNENTSEEFDIRLNTGLYVTISSGSAVTVVFDPIEDE